MTSTADGARPSAAHARQERPKPQLKSLRMAYVCLVVGGLVGLPHMYLGNWFHAFAVASTLNFASTGLFWDFVSMPWQVNAVNDLRAASTTTASAPMGMETRTRSLRYVGHVILQFLLASCYGSAARRVLCAIHDVDGVLDITDLNARLCAYALVAVATMVAVRIGVGVAPAYTCNVSVSYLGSLIALGVLDQAAQQRAQDFDPVIAASIVQILLAGATRRLTRADDAVTSKGAVKQKCRLARNLCVFSLGQVLVYALYTLSVLAAVPLPVDESGVRVDAGGTHVKPLGALLWHHRHNLTEAADMFFTIRAGQFRDSFADGFDSEADYTALGLRAGASLREVKRAYRQLALAYHPDRLPPSATPEEAEEHLAAFRRIQRAYDRIARRNKRAPG